MTERATGINTRNANEYVATFEASEQISGSSRLIQIVALSSGKIDSSVSSPLRSVSSSDSSEVTTISGSVSAGDNSFFVCYVDHKEKNGSCMITPLLCDNDGLVIGSLPPKTSKANPYLTKNTYYISSCLIWDVKGSGSWKIFPHVMDLSASNNIKLWGFMV